MQTITLPWHEWVLYTAVLLQASHTQFGAFGDGVLGTL